MKDYASLSIFGDIQGLLGVGAIKIWGLCLSFEDKLEIFTDGRIGSLGFAPA